MQYFLYYLVFPQIEYHWQSPQMSCSSPGSRMCRLIRSVNSLHRRTLPTERPQNMRTALS